MYFKGPKGSEEEGKLRPDFGIGNLDNKTTTKEFIHTCAAMLVKKEYSVEINHIFKGNEEIKKHTQ